MEVHPVVRAVYSPNCFNVTSIEEARAIILAPEDGITTEERWETETPYVMGLIEQTLQIGPSSLVVDYGCGIGRISKALIEKYFCRVIGVDISASMRAMASEYVDSDRFMACPPDMLSVIGIKADVVLAIWVLQHCFRLVEDLQRIRAALRSFGNLFVVNQRLRCVPTKEGQWLHDGVDQKALLNTYFKLDKFEGLDPAIVTPKVAATTFYATYHRD